MTESLKVKTIVLAQHFRKDSIHITHIEKPYGEYSDSVVRIDRLENEKVTGLIEIPYANLEEVISALRNAEDVNESIPHNDIHGDLKSDVGGGA